MVSKDSSFSARLNMRMQTLYQGTYDLENRGYQDGLQIRRARLKLEGFVYSPRLHYKLELGLSSADQSSGGVPQTGGAPNIIEEAVIKYAVSRSWSLWFGQTKLPGNRERLFSSQALEFVDRSNLNSKFNIDKDLGLQIHFNSQYLNAAGALSMGEGKNIVTGNSGGYDYTLRVDLLPFGPFTGNGDYSGADLAREQSPRLSIGIAYDFDDRASRQQGQTGTFLGTERNLSTVFLDAYLKYNGFSSLAEFASKQAPDGPVVTDNTGEFVNAFYTGYGFNWQCGYVFPDNFGLAARYTFVQPEKITMRANNSQYTLAASRYIVGHKLKVQTDLTWIDLPASSDQLMYRVQFELGL